MKKVFFIFLMLIVSVQEIYTQKKSQDWITIFIHGTVGLRANFSVDTFFRLLSDSIDNSKYEKNVYAIREHPLLFTVQPMQGMGLKPICQNNLLPAGPYAFSTLFDKMLKRYYCNSVNSSYYTFGWSGLLSFKRRFIEAFDLYNSLKQELLCLKKQGRCPKVRIVAYSHGGNLALNLAALRDHYYPGDTFAIDELVLMGMPVQYANACMTHGSIFKRVYHIYSCGDSVQRLDIFSPCNLFSHRRFRGCKSPRLTQIEVKVTGRLLKNPAITIPQGQRGVINQSPGHMELWFFGWTNNGYRRNFILYPLPIATFVPYLIQAAQAVSRCPSHVTIDLRPEQEIAYVTDHATKCKTAIPFMPRSELTALQWQAASYHPGQPKYIAHYLKLQETLDINKAK